MAKKSIDYFGKLFDISYDIVNLEASDTIVFLHGWGSNKELMQNAFTSKLQDYKHIYIDMPGFGQSTNNYILTTKDYANIMEIFLKTISVDISKSTIVGHSFGGKVATYLSPKILVLLSSAGIVEDKSLKTLLTIRMAKVFNRFGLAKVTKLLRSKDVENMSPYMYETFKNVVDEDFSEVFKAYTKKALIFWGEKDTATSLESGKLIHSYIKNSLFKSYDLDHYFFLHHSEDIAKVIDENKN